MKIPTVGDKFVSIADPNNTATLQALELRHRDVYVTFSTSIGQRIGGCPLHEFLRVFRPAPAPRPSVDAYFMAMAHLASTRATCDRKHVGAVIVRDGHAIATGYNGSAPGSEHCDDVGHDIVELADGVKNCVRTTHAELNAILQAAKFGTDTAGASIYTNTFPCWPCAKAILGAGIVRVVFDADYKNDPRVETAFAVKAVTVERYKEVEV